MYRDWSLCYDWPVKNAIVDLICQSTKGNSKRTSIDSLSRLMAQNKDRDAASQMLLTEFKLLLGCKIKF